MVEAAEDDESGKMKRPGIMKVKELWDLAQTAMEEDEKMMSDFKKMESDYAQQRPRPDFFDEVERAEDELGDKVRAGIPVSQSEIKQLEQLWWQLYQIIRIMDPNLILHLMTILGLEKKNKSRHDDVDAKMSDAVEDDDELQGKADKSLRKIIRRHLDLVRLFGNGKEEITWEGAREPNERIFRALAVLDSPSLYTMILQKEAELEVSGSDDHMNTLLDQMWWELCRAVEANPNRLIDIFEVNWTYKNTRKRPLEIKKKPPPSPRLAVDIDDDYEEEEDDDDEDDDDGISDGSLQGLRCYLEQETKDDDKLHDYLEKCMEHCVVLPRKPDFTTVCSPCPECGPKIGELKLFQKGLNSILEKYRRLLNLRNATHDLCTSLSSCAQWNAHMLDFLRINLQQMPGVSSPALTKSGSKLKSTDIEILQMLLEHDVICKNQDEGETTYVRPGSYSVEFESEMWFGFENYKSTDFEKEAHALLNKIVKIREEERDEQLTAEEAKKPWELSNSMNTIIEKQIKLLEGMPVRKLRRQVERLLDIISPINKNLSKIEAARDFIDDTCRDMIEIRTAFWEQYNKMTFKGKGHDSSGLKETLDSLCSKVKEFKNRWANEYASCFPYEEVKGKMRSKLVSDQGCVVDSKGLEKGEDFAIRAPVGNWGIKKKRTKQGRIGDVGPKDDDGPGVVGPLAGN